MPPPPHPSLQHFEKMGYDQPPLATAYLTAFQITGDMQYARVARAVLDYMLRDLTLRPGGPGALGLITWESRRKEGAGGGGGGLQPSLKQQLSNSKLGVVRSRVMDKGLEQTLRAARIPRPGCLCASWIPSLACFPAASAHEGNEMAGGLGCKAKQVQTFRYLP